jgi:hypothetical protein
MAADRYGGSTPAAGALNVLSTSSAIRRRRPLGSVPRRGAALRARRPGSGTPQRSGRARPVRPHPHAGSPPPGDRRTAGTTNAGRARAGTADGTVASRPRRRQVKARRSDEPGLGAVGPGSAPRRPARGRGR